ncbi:YeiH family protein [Gracilibacillus alcaliphilus]|uniref:YeiH family protein n=1 Tax=Gracilibacillus alcaliphilus TaxID=1401441 RepID=UPI001EF9A95D|nr:putative sulfate exporter family transporter [Gracilibacillus alcaliphilus]MBM7675906.1 putative integral membrane protein (TIGR00698 family) [Gracilibacillus alcaliphilus]
MMTQLLQQINKQNFHSFEKWLSGVTFTFFIALIGYVLAKVPGFDHVGQLACAILIAVMYRQFFGYPDSWRAGITFSTRRLLRAAIILYGLKLNIDIIFRDGLGLLVRDSLVIVFAIVVMMWLAKLFQADKHISLLLGIGTGICGAAAIAAVAPILNTKEEDTAISVGIIAMIGTVFAVGYTIIRPLVPADAIDYGIWSGISLHELAHVAIAAEPAGEEALAIALLAKLGRVFLLIPVCFILIYVMQRKRKEKQTQHKVEFPWFLLGFILMSLVGSYLLGDVIPVSANLMEGIASATTWILTAAMVGLGLNVNLKALRTKALKPLLAVMITSSCLTIIAYFII